MKELFRRFARRTSQIVGSPFTFIAAVLVIVIWALTGSMFHFSDTWQLVINTGTTIITFLMVFLIQNTQNRDSKAVHLKLDELIRAVGGAVITWSTSSASPIRSCRSCRENSSASARKRTKRKNSSPT